MPGLLLLLILLALGSVAVRLVPLYLDDRVVQHALNAYLEETRSDAEGRSLINTADLRPFVQRRLDINDVHEIDLGTALSIEQQAGAARIVIQYERRLTLLGNADLVLRFHNERRVP